MPSNDEEKYQAELRVFVSDAAQRKVQLVTHSLTQALMPLLTAKTRSLIAAASGRSRSTLVAALKVSHFQSLWAHSRKRISASTARCSLKSLNSDLRHLRKFSLTPSNQLRSYYYKVLKNPPSGGFFVQLCRAKSASSLLTFLFGLHHRMYEHERHRGPVLRQLCTL